MSGVAGTASFIVFMTDYESYAGVYTCQKLPAANRRSATILSRTKTLEKIVVDKVAFLIITNIISPNLTFLKYLFSICICLVAFNDTHGTHFY